MEKIAFIGAGNMAEALIRGIIRDRLVAPEEIIAGEVNPGRREEVSRELGIRVTGDNREAVAGAGIVILAVKPQSLDPVLEKIAGEITGDQLVISILAGVSTRRIEERLGNEVPVIRVMPNTPALVGAGVSVISPGRRAGEDALATARTILGAVGEVRVLEEKMIDAVTALSGSGPAYFFLLVEAMIRAGEKLGLPREEAERLAGETLAGAGRLLKESGRTAEELRRQVTSPGGTTEAAVAVFRERGLEKIVIAALEAAARRSKELGG
ncbi:MAG: pyrroline-5-carboxylate reductase [Candidatus Erginobacter occultus]|nr:pyrroline-5-carboxylate reductase [Candidatus Erginobacter occultus]